MATYQVLFSGELVGSATLEVVRDNLTRELGLDSRQAGLLFSGRTVVIRSELEHRQAHAWQERLADLGALCVIKNFAQPTRSAWVRDGLEGDDPSGQVLGDIPATRLACPRCGHEQLDANLCARCGVDLEVAFRRKRMEDKVIEKKVRALRAQSNQSPVVEKSFDSTGAEAHEFTQTKSARNKGMLSWLKKR